MHIIQVCALEACAETSTGLTRSGDHGEELKKTVSFLCIPRTRNYLILNLCQLSRSGNGGTKRTTAMRRQDENAELTELATVLPVGKNNSSVDKISVVRLTTAYLKFRNFLSEGRSRSLAYHFSPWS